MKIEKITIRKVRLPFSSDFSHSLKEGAFADNVVVEAFADGGEIRGYGESAPRPYVTGESTESVLQSIPVFLQEGAFPWTLNDVSQIWAFVDRLPDDRSCNAALCGLEMAMLDLLGKKQYRSVSDYLPQGYSCEMIGYGAALPLATKERIVELCLFIKGLGINRLKLKMGKDLRQNRGILEAFSSVFHNDYDLKTDTNGAWDLETAMAHVPLIKGYRINVVEQPMMPGDPSVSEFARGLKPLNVRLMADESACSLDEIEKITVDGYYDMVNVRLSKCGGFRRSLRIIERLRESNVPFQIGCQLGESGLLSAAGRILSLLCKDAMYHDGSYDALLLYQNITETHVSFGLEGRAGPLGGTGLGVTVSQRNLELLSDPSETITVQRPLFDQG